MHPYAQTARIRRRAFITGTAGVIIIALGAWGFARQIRATFVETKAVELKRVASTVAAQISPADHRSIKENTDQASDGYLRITGLLEEFQSRNPSVRSA
nr:hypothetical protein [bacterium]